MAPSAALADSYTTVVQTVTGTSVLGGMACPSPTTCYAVGQGSGGVIVPVTGGVAGAAQSIAGTASLSDIACPTTAFCEAVGRGPSLDAIVVPITNGTAGTAQAVSTTKIGLFAIACPSTSVCIAVGSTSSNSFPPGQGVVVAIIDGVPGAVQTLPDIFGLTDVACPSVRVCEAVGYLFGGPGVAVPITDGTAGAAVAVGGSTYLSAVACPDVSDCETAGFNATTGVVAAITNGVPGTAQTVPGTTELIAVGCSNAATCETAGVLVGSGSNRIVLAPITHGNPGPTQPVTGASWLVTLVCPTATTCLAVGEFNEAGHQLGAVVTIHPVNATFISPVDGQSDVDTTKPFSWSPTPQAQGYILVIGTTLHGTDLFNSGILPPTESAVDIPALPVGPILHATLLTEVGGTWTNFQDITFTAAPGQASFTFPLNGQSSVDPTKAFTWTTIPQAQGYVLVVGTTKYGSDLAHSGILSPTQLSYAPPTLPPGKALYATLLTETNGAWTRFQAITFTTGPAMATLTKPVNGQLNIPTPTTFTWTTVAGAQNYLLVVGTTLYGMNLVNSGILPPTQSNLNVPALPHGQVLYATLFTRINGNWHYQVVGFTASATRI
jgi:hypothetical protein